MKKAGSIYLKALLLLLVFGMNTMVSFACSLGGLLHKLNHDHGVVAVHHGHTAEAKKPHHAAEHDHSKDHHHGQEQNESPKDDCCSDSVASLQKIDKSTTRSIDLPTAIFVTSLIGSFYESSVLYSRDITISYPLHLRWRILATIPDPRIAMQSFQI